MRSGSNVQIICQIAGLSLRHQQLPQITMVTESSCIASAWCSCIGPVLAKSPTPDAPVVSIALCSSNSPVLVGAPPLLGPDIRLAALNATT
jgi:hypothetical protein